MRVWLSVCRQDHRRPTLHILSDNLTLLVHHECSYIIRTLLGDLEGLLAAQHHSLQHLVRRHVGLEVPRVPQLAHELAKPLHQEEHDVARRPADAPVVLLLQEVVPQRGHIGQRLEKRQKWIWITLHKLTVKNPIIKRSCTGPVFCYVTNVQIYRDFYSLIISCFLDVY